VRIDSDIEHVGVRDGGLTEWLCVALGWVVLVENALFVTVRSAELRDVKAGAARHGLRRMAAESRRCEAVKLRPCKTVGATACEIVMVRPSIRRVAQSSIVYGAGDRRRAWGLASAAGASREKNGAPGNQGYCEGCASGIVHGWKSSNEAARVPPIRASEMTRL
jgi:hypothetical protein